MLYIIVINQWLKHQLGLSPPGLVVDAYLCPPSYFSFFSCSMYWKKEEDDREEEEMWRKESSVL